MRKTGVILKIAAGLWVLTAVTTALMGVPAIAKYTAGATANATGTVAKFDPVWIPWESASAVGNGGPGTRDAGFVFYPGNWTAVKNVPWRLRNDGQVTLNALIVPRLVQGMTMKTGYSSLTGTGNAQNRASNTHVGVYSPTNTSYTAALNPVWKNFTNTEFRRGVSTGNNFSTGAVSWTPTNNTYSTLAEGQTVTWVSPRAAIASGGSQTFMFTIQGYGTAPNKNTITSGRLTYGVGTSTLSDMYSTYWRSYRVNAAAYVEQVD